MFLATHRSFQISTSITLPMVGAGLWRLGCTAMVPRRPGARSDYGISFGTHARGSALAVTGGGAGSEDGAITVDGPAHALGGLAGGLALPLITARAQMRRTRISLTLLHPSAFIGSP